MRKLVALFLVLLTLVSSEASISRSQVVSADAATATISGTTNADLILVFAFNGSTTTAPSLPSGFSNLGTSTGSGTAARTGYKVSTGGDTDCGTWTGATNIVCHVYAGTGGSPPVLNLTPATANTTTLSYTGFTMTHADGTGWIVGMGAAAGATAGMNGSTTHLVNRTSTSKINGLDYSGPTSWSTETLSFTGTNGWRTVTSELVAATPTPTPSSQGNFFQLF